MYRIKIDIGENSVSLMPSYGYYVAHIDGLTGVSANFSTVKAVDGYGESITGKTIPPKSLVITGVILDGNTTAKQNLLNVVKAGMEGVLTVYKLNDIAARPVPYRRAKVFVKQSPIITQERHSKFSFTLTMPNPYWEDVSEKTIAIKTASEFETVTVLGDVPPEFEVQFTTTEDVDYVTINGRKSAYAGLDYFMFDFTQLPNYVLPSGNTVHMWWENGRLRVTRTDGNTTENIIRTVYTASKLWRLFLGSEYGYDTLTTSLTNAVIKYRPLYTGVLVDDV